jgi:hypothetical protein
MSNRVVVRACLAGNRFLGFLKGLQIRYRFSSLCGLCPTYFTDPVFAKTSPKRWISRKLGLYIRALNSIRPEERDRREVKDRSSL